jgi:hypothetical protein
MRSWLGWAAVTAAVLALLLGGSRDTFARALAQGGVTVQGQIVNGTAGAPLTPGLRVVLHSFGPNLGLVSTVQTVADAAGRFQFPDVVLRDTGSYAFAVEYAGVTYTTVAGALALAAPVQVTVYQTTQDVASVRVQRQVWFISQVDTRNQEIAAVEFIHLVNNGDRTLLPDLTTTGQISFLRFSLPAGVVGLEVDSGLPGGQIIPIGTGFAVTAPVFPGPHDLTFAYRFPYRGAGVSYNQRLLQGAELYQVLVPQRLDMVQVAGLDAQPSLDLEGTVYRVWEGRGFGPGQGPVVSLSGLPQPSLLARLTRGAARPAFWEAAIPSILGAVLALLLIYGVVKAPGWARASARPVADHGNGADRHALVQAIAVLDQRFQTGGLDPADYQSQRRWLKARALGVAGGDARLENGPP